MSGFLITRLQFQSDVLNLLPEKAPRTQAFVKFLKEFGSGDSLFIVLERKSGEKWNPSSPLPVLVDRLLATGNSPRLSVKWPRGEGENGQSLSPQGPPLSAGRRPEGGGIRLSDRGIGEQIRLLKTRLSSMFTSPWQLTIRLIFSPCFRKTSPSTFPCRLRFPRFPDFRRQEDDAPDHEPKGSAPDLDYDERLVRRSKTRRTRPARDWARKRGPFGRLSFG
jgi:hypothetical protein